MVARVFVEQEYPMDDTPPLTRTKSPEEVAYDLVEMIAKTENLALTPFDMYRDVVDRAWIPDTYAECLKAAKGDRKAKATGSASAT